MKRGRTHLTSRYRWPEPRSSLAACTSTVVTAGPGLRKRTTIRTEQRARKPAIQRRAMNREEETPKAL